MTILTIYLLIASLFNNEIQAGWFPMLLSPVALDGTMAGDVGFDPFG